MEQLFEKIFGFDIRKVSCSAFDALFYRPGVRAICQHGGIMVGFKDQQRAALQMLFHHRGGDAKIGCNSNGCAVLYDGKPYGIFGIMGYGKRVNRQPVNLKRRSALEDSQFMNVSQLR